MLYRRQSGLAQSASMVPDTDSLLSEWALVVARLDQMAVQKRLNIHEQRHFDLVRDRLLVLMEYHITAERLNAQLRGQLQKVRFELQRRDRPHSDASDSMPELVCSSDDSASPRVRSLKAKEQVPKNQGGNKK